VRLASPGELSTDSAEQRLEEALVAARASVTWWQTTGELPVAMLRHALRGPRPGAMDELQAMLERGRASQSFVHITAARLPARLAVEIDPGHPERARALADEEVSEGRIARRDASDA